MNKKIECIRRLIKKNNSYREICDWLLERNLAEELEVNSYSRDQERAEFIHKKLEEADKNKKFLLLDFEWTVLPLEQIKITIVTEKEQVEFSFGH